MYLQVHGYLMGIKRCHPVITLSCAPFLDGASELGQDGQEADTQNDVQEPVLLQRLQAKDRYDYTESCGAPSSKLYVCVHSCCCHRRQD